MLRVGDTPTSKPLRELLARTDQLVLDPHAAWHEPTRQAELLLHAAAAPACDAIAAALEMRTSERDPAWLESWRTADAAVPRALAEAPDRFEPKALAALEPALPPGATVWIGSSMPIRDVEAYFPQSDKPIRFLANRGANGIDGVVASAAGAALAAHGRAWLLTGELALLHDIGGLLAARRAGAELTIVCLDNGGGSIFDFLPVAQAADAEIYERHIATPSGIDFEKVAALADMPYSQDASDPGLVVIRTDRADNVRLHRETVDRAAAALGWAGPTVEVYLGIAAILAASALVGCGLCVVAGCTGGWTAPLVGLAALLALANLAVYLPGAATAAGVAMAAAALVAAVALLRRRPSPRRLPAAILVGSGTLAFASLPFVASGRVGIPRRADQQRPVVPPRLELTFSVRPVPTRR